ncbi:putative electron transport protein [Escherichia coli]|uniref:Putative electron transport protein n=1 Tax=Escherichia coli TaxID=562 RepID=A0A376UCX3_ECOLX|nr:putative electron transport protein [Escherichia coli]
MCPSPLAGYSSARREVFAVEFFSLYRVIDARSGDSLFYVVALPAWWMDVKMLDFFRHMGTATLISVTVLLIASLFIRHAWCRYLCPYGALMGVVSLLSPFKIRRNAESCIDCGKCAKNCPSRIPVDKLIQVRTVECTGCMTCVESCPVASTLTFSLQNLRQIKKLLRCLAG